MSPRWNWDSPTPLAASECALPPVPKGGGGGGTLACCKRVGESQFQRLEKRLALCLLCAFSSSRGVRTLLLLRTSALNKWNNNKQVRLCPLPGNFSDAETFLSSINYIFFVLLSCCGYWEGHKLKVCPKKRCQIRRKCLFLKEKEVKMQGVA